MMVATNYISIWSQELGRVIMSLWSMMSINQCPSIVFMFMLSRSEDMIKSDREAAKLSKWFCSMMLLLHLAGDRVNMGCNDILMLVAAPVSGSRWLVPVSRDVGTHSGTGIAASETRAVSRDWALNMRQRPPYTPDTQVHYTWSWLLLSF